MRIGIVGYGTMGRAIATILHATSPQRYRIFAFTKNPVADGIVTHVSSYDDICARTDVLFFCVKPQDFLMMNIPHRDAAQPLVISIMAGICVETLQRILGHTAIVRAMPNIPLRINKGVIGWYVQPETLSKNELRIITDLLQTFGTCIRVSDEDHLNIITALSGSGPAYVFLFMDTLIRAGTHLGLTQEQSAALVFATMEGSVAYARAAQDDTSLDQLIYRVTSRGGTTEAALQSINPEKFHRTWRTAIEAAYRRAQKLSH